MHITIGAWVITDMLTMEIWEGKSIVRYYMILLTIFQQVKSFSECPDDKSCGTQPHLTNGPMCQNNAITTAKHGGCR